MCKHIYMQCTCVVYVHAVRIYVCKCPCACGKPEENGGGPAYHTIPKSSRQGLTVELGWPPANRNNPPVSIPQCWGCWCAQACPAFRVDAGDSNSGSHLRTAVL